MITRYGLSFRRFSLLMLVLALAFLCATLPAALRWQLLPFSSSGLKESSAITAEGQRIYLRVWPGGMWAKDALNLSIAEASPASFTAATSDSTVPLPRLRDGLPSLLPRHAWSQMIAESRPAAGDFVNLQAWGFPRRALAGGFSNGPSRRIDWYQGIRILGRTFEIPTRPIWSGILLNTAFYAVLILGLAWLARAFGRRIARWRSARRAWLCPHCRYDRTGLTIDALCRSVV